jgi:hypothetical protein
MVPEQNVGLFVSALQPVHFMTVSLAHHRMGELAGHGG